ncbi:MULTISPECIES: hypothetical protein [Enterobacter cloacae complex]|uniref:hypothetical protein n=1 Tax=Enterobacter cloacae complex TaxID=354276 RepID=UPI000799DCEA|nr:MULTISPECIES: hypothetical protein [Enterobacter cloacae complex]AWC84816.1 hypothetical protein AM410_10385 [Enterobacter cloacae complex sp. FDA-CDC-AR_0164]CZU61700.1 Uncharacterised protein [Enterobacter hormaechei]
MNIELKITLWALACAYAIGNSFIYSWAFWSAFEINILQFASFTEILPSILYTIAIPCIVVSIGIVAADYWEKLKTQAYSMIENEFAARIKYYHDIKYIFLISVSAIGAIVGIIAAVALYKSDKEGASIENYPWGDILQVAIPFAISVFAFWLITKKTTFLNELKLARRLAIIIICILPVVSYLWGYINSTKIINGRDTFLIQSDGQCKTPSNTKYRYISSISDKVFALSLSDGSVCVFKYNSLQLTPEQAVNNMKAIPSTNI